MFFLQHSNYIACCCKMIAKTLHVCPLRLNGSPQLLMISLLIFSSITFLLSWIASDDSLLINLHPELQIANEFDPDSDAIKSAASSIHSARAALMQENPMHSAVCRDAIIDREGINISQLLSTHLPKIYNASDDPSVDQLIDFLMNRSIPQFWGREQLNALQHDIVWWNGARVIVTDDPYWYYELEIGGDFTESHQNSQRRIVGLKGNNDHKERLIHDLGQIHYLKNINLQSPNYNLSRPIQINGYNNTFRENNAMSQVAYCMYSNLH